jgi:hypothetical protein
MLALRDCSNRKFNQAMNLDNLGLEKRLGLLVMSSLPERVWEPTQEDARASMRITAALTEQMVEDGS